MSQKRQGQISRIVIKGYKSIIESDIEFGNLNILIGSNGAGKSNFMSIFPLLQNIDFVSIILSPYLQNVGIITIPIICMTKRTPTKKYKGGVSRFGKISCVAKKEGRRFLRYFKR